MVFGKDIKKRYENSDKEKMKNVEIQLQWIIGIYDQIEFLNNPENLTEFVLKLIVSPRQE